MVAYFAHTAPEGQPWEPLLHHLQEVADLAAALAARFGCAEFGRLAGLLHDIGKYSPAFQARLQGAAARVDHSTAGAVWAKENLPEKWGRLIAHAVAGHHAGLQDDLFGPDGRLDGGSGLLAAVARTAKSDGLLLPQTLSKPEGMRFFTDEGGFQRAFLTRMIFSCLIDADRTAAARFDAQSRGETVAAITHPAIAALEAQLMGWIAARDAKPSPLNTLRDGVLREAMAKAAAPPGVFTLTVPTGGGKTLTSLAFALAHARQHHLDRVIVVIPYTSIIEQTAEVYRTALEGLGDAVLEHHSAFEMADEATWSGERTGPDRLRLSMERWDKPIVVTTAVQFFESLFSNRPSRCRKLHSIARSVVVLDEAQTMPLALLRPCVAALKELTRNYGSSVVLCTATQPALTAPLPGSEAGFAGGFDNPQEIIADVPALFAQLRRVTLRDIGPQTDSALADRIAAAPQVLCIVNQRAHARALYDSIKHLPGARHLSTCMHSVHRRRILAEIRDDLKRERPCQVVSTSLVEAGVDVDFPLVLRATAGLDQIAQAAGRCNREFRRTPEESEVLVFSSPAYKVIPKLRRNAEAGGEVLGLHADDPFSPEAMTAFFRMLYWRHGDDALDDKNVLALCGEKRGDLNFPFADIAARMRFIDDAMVPVIVPVEDDGEVKPLLDQLPYVKGTGGIAQKLGRYTVGVPCAVRAEMLAKGAVTCIEEAKFGDQFVVLSNLDLYSPEAGLDWSDLTFRKAEGLMLT
ncbi:CRISPR-associated endonuclease Cas3'' [Acidisoma cellulosilytica]|uniref:CRISPR-associated endonuclease Cas3 n=1 Tax=Acidisoma cellulosilyticum TaxID=2802395 RepID=A0A963YY75_9PROT|nr:CRISPR-associated endonuclease Cas3'' [Acidisoma cellulosilyticum]MCB8879381.1 CRISPR-associated endonuclease Cas3'' [Acidisoma cellulosilyticum]